MVRGFLFPGQGSQNIGMGRALADNFAVARHVFQEVDEALTQRLSKLMWEGPDSELVLTENAQPAIMAASIAVVRVLEAEDGLDFTRHARLVAGHSLGEYSALCAIGSIALADAARLLRTRGRAMQQVVISGTRDAVQRAGEMARAKGARRVMPLAVSAPFHCPLMEPAAKKMREALSEVTIRPPPVPIVSNVTASETDEPETIRRLLVEQVTSRVRWRESVLNFRLLGLSTTVEVGGNRVLTGMVKRIDSELLTVSIDTPQDIEAFAKVL
jgi:[acyl-carrier-protein] S-malonyltransferase